MDLEHIVRTMVAGSQNTDRAATSSRFSFNDDDGDDDEDDDVDGAAQRSRDEAERRSLEYVGVLTSAHSQKVGQ